MKKIILILILFASIISTGATPVTGADPLLKLTEIAAGKKLPISNWDVTIRETKKNGDFQEFVEKPANSHLVSRTEDENSIKYMFDDTHKLSNIVVQYSVIVPKDKLEDVEQIAVIKSDVWNEEMKEDYLQINDEIRKNMFSDKARTFTCIEFIEGGIIGDDMIVDYFIQSLELVHIETQDDQVQKSRLIKTIDGYTPLWKQKFTLNGIPFNLQFAIIELENEKKSYKIGTPILINEY